MSSNPCSKPVIVTIEGKNYCKIHHPDAVKAREEKSAKRWEEKFARRPIFSKDYLKRALHEQRVAYAERARAYGRRVPEAMVFAEQIALIIEKGDG